MKYVLESPTASAKYYWVESKLCPGLAGCRGGRHRRAGVCVLSLLSIQRQIMLVTVQNVAVNSKRITRVLK